MTEYEGEKKAEVIFLKAENGGDWELVKPEDVPEVLKEPYNLGAMLHKTMPMRAILPSQPNTEYRATLAAQLAQEVLDGFSDN